MPRLASFHLLREPLWRAPQAMTRLGTDRLRLRGVAGLCFHRLLATGHRSSTAFGIAPARTALFAVWQEPAALDAFLGGGWFARRAERAAECWSVRLLLLGGHGRWLGVDVLDDLLSGTSGGAVAVLTRADVKVRHWGRFQHAGPPVSGQVGGAPGLLAVVAIGEAPLGRQATFSLWRSARDLTAFAYRGGRHAEVVRRTRAEGWYSEELFARFQPVGATGTWDRRDPLVTHR